MNFVEELRWRGMIHNIMPGTEEQIHNFLNSKFRHFTTESSKQ